MKQLKNTIDNIIIDYLLNKITFDDVYEEFNKLIYQTIKEEVKNIGKN